MKKKYIFTKEELIDLYQNKNYNTIEIGKMKGCSCQTVNRELRKFGIPIKDYPGRAFDLRGKKFGKLTILEESHRDNAGIHWKVRCDCGIEKTVVSQVMRRGIVKSCGCIRFKGYQEIYLGFWHRILHHAKTRNLKVEVTIEQIWDLFIKQDRKCALTGVPLEFANHYTKKTSYKCTASLDRIDSSKHYTLDNIQWVHKDINSMKMDMSEDKFIKYCYLISEMAKKNGFICNETCKKEFSTNSSVVN